MPKLGLHKSTAANEPDKQLFNVSTIQSNNSLQFVTPVINRFVDDLLVKILPACAHTVFEVIQAGNQNVMYALLQTPAPKKYQASRGLYAIAELLVSPCVAPRF